MDTVAVLRQAIREKKQVTAYYHRYYREMCPHVLGWKENRARCLFYQFAGDTSDGSIGVRVKAEWKCMDVDKLQQVQLREGAWHTERTWRTRRQHCMDIVELEAAL